MLNKNRSGKLARLKYLAALPLCAGMLCTSTLVFSKDYGFIDLSPQNIDSTRYALKLTDVKHNISGVSDKIAFTKNGVTTTYTLNTLTEKQITDLKEKGYDMSIVERAAEFSDTIKRKMPPPPPPPAPPVKAPKFNKVPPPPVTVPNKPPKVEQLPPPPPEPPKPLKNRINKIKFPPPIVKPDKPNKVVRVETIAYPKAVVIPDVAPKPSTFSIGTPPSSVVKADVAPTAGRSTWSIGTPPAKPAVVKSDVAPSRQDTIRQRR